ncbi:hypothetical protein [Amycolatopsis methanolica]|uniref:hypothetical protein n=1 Tax=Amycolatopsis methanolica TaxID=1814 RepID=UPI0003624871|nr:hypothetical protein [Amycolatopsis methanolica]
MTDELIARVRRELRMWGVPTSSVLEQAAQAIARAVSPLEVTPQVYLVVKPVGGIVSAHLDAGHAHREAGAMRAVVAAVPIVGDYRENGPDQGARSSVRR